MMNLSKSRYCKLCQCARLLWLDVNRRKPPKKDQALERRMQTGQELTVLARGRFGDYTDVTVLRDGSPDLSAMIRRTQACLEAGVENICEASFSYEGLYCAVDILHREKGGYAIYEVKSSTDVKKEHGYDVAFQKYVLEHCGIHVTGTYLLYVNNEYVRGEALDVRQLFKVGDMAETVAEELPNIPGRLALAEQVLAGEEPDQPIGSHCGKPGSCPYWSDCAAHLPEHNVFDLYKMQTRTMWKHYRNGLVSFEDLDGKVKLSVIQKRQMDSVLCDEQLHIEKEKIADFLKGLRYPLYFLDFESMQLAIPQFSNTKPYDQLLFQYSLHYIEEEGGKLEHKAFLAVSGEDPRRAIAESLCRAIPMGACVTVYNQTFEKTRLQELADDVPEFREHLLDIKENIVDLFQPFADGNYYDRKMGSSFSIKVVLPVLFPDDDSLNYDNLAGDVHNGTAAMDLFPKIKDLPPEQQQKARQDLLDYCWLDTYAMVKLWEKLKEAAQ